MSDYSNEVNRYIMSLEQSLERLLDEACVMVECDDVEFFERMLVAVVQNLPDKFKEEMGTELRSKIRNFEKSDTPC